MYYGEIKKVDIANGPGTRVSLFVSGCRRHCKDCFNAETWDFCFGGHSPHKRSRRSCTCSRRAISTG